MADASPKTGTARSACDLIAIHCSDYRHTNGIYTMDRAVKERFGQQASYDAIVKPGGPFAFVHGSEHHRVAIMDDLTDLVTLHGFRSVMLVPHMSCGKYGLWKKFASKDAEHQQLLKDIAASSDIIRKTVPGIRVFGAIAEMSPTTLLRLEDVFDSL